VRKITKIVATRCHILKLIRFRLGRRRRLHWGSFAALPTDPLAGFKGGCSKETEEREEGEAKEGEGRGGDLLLRRGGGRERRKGERREEREEG